MPPKQESSSLSGTVINREQLSYMAQMMKQIRHPLRIQILLMLEHTPELAAGTFHRTLNEPQPTVSQHLSGLRNSGVLKIRKRGGHIFYSLLDTRAIDILNCVKGWPVPAATPLQFHRIE